MSRNRVGLHIIITLGVTIASLLGCASTEPKLRKANKLDIQYKNPSPSLSDEPATEKKLSKMTSLDLERSGDLQLSRGNLHMAYIQYEKSLRFNPDNTRARYKKGLLLIVARMNGEAIKEFQEVLKREPEHALAYEGLGKAYFQMKKYDEAERSFRRGLALDPKLWKAHNFLGIIYDHQERHDLAVREFEAAIRLEPDVGLLYNNLGVSYSLAGDYKKALDAFNKALKRNYLNNKFYNNLGLVLSKLGRHQEALEAFKKEGDQARAYNNLGSIYLEEGEFEKAISYFEKAIEIKPAFYAKASDNLERARLIHSRESSLESNVQSLPSPQAEQPAVSQEEKREHQEEASGKAQMESVTKAPANPDQEDRGKKLTNYLQEPVDGEVSKAAPSKMSSHSSDHSPSAQMGDPAIELLEGNEKAEAYSKLGWTYLRQGESEKAIRYFEKAMEIKLASNATATDSLNKAEMGHLGESSPKSNVKNPSNAQAEKPGVDPEDQEKASATAQMDFVMQAPTNPEQGDQGKKLQASPQRSVHVEASKTDSSKTVSISPGARAYAKVESPTVERLVEGKGFRLKFKLVNPDRELPIAGTVAIIASLNNSHMPQFISFPRMELDDAGLPVKLNRDLRFRRITRFMVMSGEFTFPLADARSFRILVYNPSDQLVHDQVVLPEEVSSI